MAVIKEFRCFDHGEFEASHAICPHPGCDSKAVFREFRTAPTIGSRMVRQHHEGLKRSSDMYKIANFRSARAGEAAHGGQTDTQGRVLWGDESRKVLGKSFAELTQIAQRPFSMRSRAGNELTLTRNNGMADVATEAGITSRRIAKPGELKIAKGEARSEAAAKSITA
jgi:hypothetical protein